MSTNCIIMDKKRDWPLIHKDPVSPMLNLLLPVLKGIDEFFLQLLITVLGAVP
jgi:hypothetical protein